MNDLELEDKATAERLAQQLLESTGKDGVYYALPFPTRWRLYAFPWADFGDLWHSHAWHKYVAVDLAEAWSRVLNVPVHALKSQLMPWFKGLPRGRVERSAAREYVIFHGDDLAATGISRERIQTAFELFNSKVTWSLDTHEQQDPQHQAEIKRVLHLDLFKLV